MSAEIHSSINIRSQIPSLYCISATTFPLDRYNIKDDFLYAACGSKSCIVFSCKSCTLHAIYTFELPSNDEDLYTCTWLQLPSNKLCIALAGKSQTIYLVDVIGKKVVQNWFAHGKSVFHLLSHPFRKDILFSCSEDLSVKMWHVSENSSNCLKIFAGEQGHKGPVLALDVNSTATLLCSSGMDYQVKVWEIGDSVQSTTSSFVVQSTLHSSNRILKEYIDCVKWFGSLIICKGIHGKLRIVRFTDKNSVQVMCDLLYDVPSPLWFFRFAIDPITKILLVGGSQGKIFVFDLHSVSKSFSVNPIQEIKLNRSSNVRDLWVLGGNVHCITEEGMIFLVQIAR